MTSIFEITDWAHVASFFVWTLAVCALAKAIFGSFLAAEVQYRLALRDNPRRQRLNRLNWEVANRTKWDDDIARGSPHAVRVPLTESEMEARRAELRQVSGNSLSRRALLYFANCFACQAFWTSLGMYALTRGVEDVAACLLGAAAYSGAATMLLGVQAERRPAELGRSGAIGGCHSCGGGAAWRQRSSEKL